MRSPRAVRAATLRVTTFIGRVLGRFEPRRSMVRVNSIVQQNLIAFQNILYWRVRVSTAKSMHTTPPAKPHGGERGGSGRLASTCCTVSMTHSYIQNLVWHLQIISCSLPTGSTTHMLGRSSSCSRTPSNRSPPRAPLPHRLLCARVSHHRACTTPPPTPWP